MGQKSGGKRIFAHWFAVSDKGKGGRKTKDLDMERQKTVILHRGKEKSLSRRHPWIFSGAIYYKDKDLSEGDVVRVLSFEEAFLCVGLYQGGSIAVKVLGFEDRDVDYPFILSKVEAAVGLRRAIGLFSDPETTIFRLINGEGDFLPSLIADYYDGLVVLQFHSLGMWRLSGMIVKALRETLGQSLKAVFNKSSSTLRFGGTEGAKDGFLLGSVEEDFSAKENGITYRIDYALGQKTGFFIDQRDNRKLVCELAKGRNVLNAFAYTGGFSLSAIKGEAKRVESLDISARAVNICNDNAAMNFPECGNHFGVVADVVDYLDKMPKGEFDLIVLDPPAFAKHAVNLSQALKGYRAINLAAMRKIASGGFLFTFSCSQVVSREDFTTMLFSCAALSGRNVRVVRPLGAGEDHPRSIFHPEGEYLKGMLLYVE